MGIFYLTTWNRVLPIKDRRRSNPSQHHNACTKLSLLSANQEPPRLEGCFQIPKCPFPSAAFAPSRLQGLCWAGSTLAALPLHPPLLTPRHCCWWL